MTRPLPLEMVLAGRDLTEPRLDSTGTIVRYVLRWRSAVAVCERPVAGDGPERFVSVGPDPAPGRGLGGGCFSWLGDGGLVYATADGDLCVQSDGDVRAVVVDGACRAPVPVGPDLDGGVVCVVDEAQVWRVGVDGNRVRLDDGRHEFCFDPAVSPDGDVVSWLGWSPPAMPWDAAERVDLHLATGSITTWRPGTGAVQQPRYMPDGGSIAIDDGSGWLNVAIDGRPIAPEPIEHGGPTWGMGQRSFAVSPDGTQVAFTRNRRGYGSLAVADRGSGDAVDVAEGVHGHLDWAGDRLVAVRSSPATGTDVVVYSTATWDARVIAAGQPAGWPGADLPPPEPVETTVDGTTLHARRYPAAGAGGAGAGRMLCWVHGGPTDQWLVDARPRIAYWTTRGWDVLVVDPRGTTGHGREYQQALHGQWGRLDVDDTAALVAAAHRAGWARPATTVAIGGSSGGLTVLGLLADHPDLVAAGVASYPVSDLLTLAEATHRFEAHYTDTLVGPVSDTARYTALSPIHRADRITSPLLVFHGTDDPVVPIAQSAALASRIRDAGGDVELVVYEGEGHGFRDPVHQRDEYARTEAFLERATTAGG